jgi:hypothetical protein
LFSDSALTIILIVLVGVVAASIFIRWPPLGILVAMLGGLFIPYSGPSGLNATLIVVAFLLGLWIVEMLVSRSERKVISSRILWLSLAFIFTSLLSFGLGQLNWYNFGRHAPVGAQAGGAAIFILSIGAFLLAATRIGSLKWLEWLTWAYIGVSGAILFFRVLGSWTGVNLDFISFISTPGAVFWIWAAGLTTGQAVFNRKLHPGVRILLFLIVVLICYHLYFERFQNKSGWVSVFICIAAVVGSRSFRTSVIIFITLAIVLAGLYFFSDAISSEDYSLSTRLEAGELMVEMLRANPLLGLGFANPHEYATLFPIRGWDVEFSSHNNFIDITLQTGLLGLFLFLALLAEITMLMLRLRKRIPPGGFSQAYLYSSLGCLAGMIVAGLLADWILPFFYNIGLNGFRVSVIGWLFLGGILLLERAYPPKPPSEELHVAQRVFLQRNQN